MNDLVEGKNTVLEALRANRPINKVLVAEGINQRGMQEIYRLARELGVPVQQVDRRKLDAIAQTQSHQGVIAQAAPKAYVDIDEILAAAAQSPSPPLLVLLDDLEDPHNLGAILRSADAAGAHGVVIPKRHGVPLTAAVARASAGAVEYVPVARVGNIAQTIDFLKGKGIWVAGATMEAVKLHYEEDFSGPLALVIGGEGKGLSRLVKEKCDFLVRIPMQGRLNSLNAAVSASILLFEAVRQRLPKR
ncbi:MAG: 23S rRNA (guanosine(2251)-2'-O)-methyltransferase RlmB [Syntrophomonadaceae bacterium]|nr:23S rRNA (guanosine(2251)-2'-O)-methyltransferase RlmB [Syntrophomonadaceae bacterium]